MSKRHNILLTRNSYFISSAGEIESVQELKTKFFSSCFNAGDSHIKSICLHIAVFKECDILHF